MPFYVVFMGIIPIKGSSTIRAALAPVKGVRMSSYDSFGRMNQKRRTRAALMTAAAEFVRRGETPSILQVADAALVSKSTAYRYFPSQDALLAEALLDV